MAEKRTDSGGTALEVCGGLILFFGLLFAIPIACSGWLFKEAAEVVKEEQIRQGIVPQPSQASLERFQNKYRVPEVEVIQADAKPQDLIEYEQMPAAIAEMDALLAEHPDPQLQAKLDEAKAVWETMTRLTQDVMIRTSDGQVGLGINTVLIVVEDKGDVLLCTFKGQQFEIPAASTDWPTGRKKSEKPPT